MICSRRPRRLFGVAYLASIPFLPLSAFAQDTATDLMRPHVAIEIGYGQTDNLGRDTVNEVRSDITTVGLDIGATTDRTRLDGTVVSDIEWQRYHAPAVVDSEDIVGFIDGALALHAIPDVLLWDFSVNYGQSRSEPLAPINPDNREATRIAETGPRIVIPLGERNEINFDFKQASRKYEDSVELDSDVSAATFGISHAFDTATALSFWFNGRDTEYDNSGQHYEYRSASIAYFREFSSGAIEASVGRGEIEYGLGSEPTTIGGISWERGIASRSRVRLWLSQDYTDSGELFSLGGMGLASQAAPAAVPNAEAVGQGFGSEELDTNDARLANVVLNDDASLRSAVGMLLTLAGRDTNVGVSLEAAENDFVTDDTLDSDLQLASVSIAHNLGGAWRFDAGMTLFKERYATSNVENKDQHFRVALVRAVGRNSNLAVEFQRNRRHGGVDLYDENVYRLSFGHDLTR